MTRLVLVVIIVIASVAAACTREPAPPSAQSSAAPVALTFTVHGMHCNGCAESVTDTVSKMDGVVECRVSFDEGSAIVTVTDPAIADRIIEKIVGLGYTAERVGS